MDEHDVVEAGTDLLFGDPKSVLKKIGLSILDKKQFEAIFVSAGKTVAEYEKDNTEQNDIRRILFCEETMRLLANEIRKSNSFDWLKDLDRCVNDLLSLSELDSINKARCKKHFEDIVIYQIKKLFPQRYGSYCLGDIHDNVNSLMASTQSSNETLNKILELMSQNDGEYNQKSPTTHEDWQDKSSYTLLEWHLERAEVDGIFAHKDSYTDDIIKLTEAWQKERDEYPGWYIIPYNTAVELNMYTDEKGLLQKHETVNIDVMLDFAYELCWRRIKIMLPYSEYEVFHLRQIWDKYYVKITENAGDSDKIRKWFYIGQILLSDYRESMNWNEWQRLMDILIVYQESGNNGKVDLMIERAKACYFKLDIPSLRRELDQCDIPKECYEQRLLVIGLDLECGKLEESLEKLKQLRQDLICKVDENNENYYLKSLEASVLQLLSICQQAYSLHKEIYEFEQMGIDEILEEIDRKKEFFNWESWKNNVAKELFNHCVDNQFEKETFELNRSTMTICSYSRSGHAEGYQLYKVLEKLGIPFKCGCVTVISNMELSLIASIYNFNNRLGLLLLVRCSSTGTIEKLVNRKFVMDLESGYIDDVIDILINAIEVKDSNDLYLKQLTLLCANTELGYWNENDVLIIINKISKYWYKIAENTANIMFEDNSRKAVYAIAAVLENCNGMISDEAREILIKLAHEMNEKGIYTKCFDIFILRDEQWERDVQENIFAMNESQSIDSLRAMEKYIIRYPDSVTTSQMLGKIVELIELRKEPGLLSAIWILHNLVYAKNTVIDTIGIERIDRLLVFLAELINYDNAAMKDIKHCIELRQACAALAFRLFDWKTVNCGKGVEKWREICKSSDEANEVRNQWIW